MPKKLVLVYPPLCMPTSPPLGVCMLKGYVERNLPDWRVRVIDLNLWTFERLLGGIASGGYRLDRQVFPEGALAEIALSRAVRVLRDPGGQEFFERPDRYEIYADLLLRLTETFTQQLCALAASAEQGGPVHPIFDEQASLVLGEDPGLVGISASFSHQLPVAALLGKLLRRRGLKVVLGGGCFTDTAEHFMRLYPEAGDSVITGDGERSLLQLLTGSFSPERVPGAVYIDGGQLRRNEPDYPTELDVLGAPDFGDLNLRRYFSPEPVVPLLLSRGCYWRRCTFCVHHRSAGMKYRLHGIPFVVETLKRFVAQGLSNFAFIDEMIAPNHFERLAGAIVEAGLKINYYALSKPVKQFTPELLSLMARSGCKYLLWGVESGSQRVLDLMDKGTNVQDVSKVLKASGAAGMANHVYIICGFPTETEEEFFQTLHFLNEHRDCIYSVHRGTFSLEPHSPIFDDPARFGITRTWMKREDHLGGRWGFECSSGMSSEKTMEVFQAALPFLRAFNPFTRHLGNYRDHALLIYKRVGPALRPQSRTFPEFRDALPERPPARAAKVS